MNKKAIFTLYSFFGLIFLATCEFFYLQEHNPSNIKEKQNFTKFISLPDLAIANETYYIRHRTLSNVFEIYKDDGTLREYSKTSFVIGDFK